MSFWENLWDIFWWFFTAFVFFAYLSRPRRRMADRSVERARRDQEEADSFIRRASDANPDEIAKAKALLDAGTISPEECARLQSRVLV